MTIDDLPFLDGDESPPTANGAKGAKPCRRHSWRQSPFEGEGVVCWKCGKPKDASSRRGRTSLRAGKDAERAIARAYGGKRTGQYGGPDDVLTSMFVVQSKAGGWFSERVWAELVKLPRSGGRIPTLVVSDRPGPGHPTRRYVVRMLADDLDLHGPDAA
jgi:hypothetical protein